MIQEIQTPQILKEFDQYWLMYKPSGWFVHPPSDRRALKQFSGVIMTSWFWRALNRKGFPVHRLDFATEGLMIWAKDPESAGVLNELHFDDRLQKTYRAVVRGHTPLNGTIEVPLLSDSSPEEVACKTEFKTLSHLELPVKINSSHPTSRYSFVEAYLKTGRWHQIRRHFNRISHPIIGDREHGDSHHNRYFRDELKLSSLLLKAEKLEFICPFTNENKLFQAPETPRWQRVNQIFESPKLSVPDNLYCS